MTYAATNPPKLVVPRVGDGNGLWIYRSADAHGDVDATDYFTNGAALGMKVGDVVIVITSTTELATIHAVLAVDADGNATISAAVLS